MADPSLTRVKPAALRPGDKVGIVAPASNIKRELLEAGCQRLRSMGYQPLYSESILDQDLYFAGSVERRLRELEEMFCRDDVRAIICARGGYGTNYLLQKLDMKKIKIHPKIFVGYSDITTLLTYFCDAGNFVTFHGPMVTKDFPRGDGIDSASWEAALSGRATWNVTPNPEAKPLVRGNAEGILYGGCLSMLVESIGTPYEIQTAGTILFIEDLAAKPYQIDRMLMHLKLAGKFEGIRGLILGEMLDCIQTVDQGYKLEDIILRIAGDLGIPVAYGLRSGHVSSANITLPFGVNASLRVDTAIDLRILEPATLA